MSRGGREKEQNFHGFLLPESQSIMKVQYFIIHFGYFIINRDNRFHIETQIDRYLFIEKNEERMSRGGREKEQNFDGFLLSENRSIITSNRSLSKENSLLLVGLGYRA